MGKADEYVERAAECVENVEASQNLPRKKLLQIAKAWSELAKTGTITPPLARLNLRNRGAPIDEIFAAAPRCARRRPQSFLRRIR
jgi:hypothetical protein